MKKDLWKLSLLILTVFAQFSAYAMMDERKVTQTIILDPSLPFSQQVTESKTCYVVRDEFSLGADAVDLPPYCVLSFEGGRLANGTLNANGGLIGNPENGEIFSSGFMISNISNEDVYLSWFSLDREKDAAALIQGLVRHPHVKNLHLSGKTFQTTYINLEHGLSIIGEDAVIHPIPMTSNSYHGLFRCVDGYGFTVFHLSGFSVIGDKEMKLDAKVLGERLFHFNHCLEVSFDEVTIGDITGGYGTSAYGYPFNAGLIACYDVRSLSIRNCEFHNNKCFEWICNMPVLLHRNDLNVVFDQNYIHDAKEGATPVYFICNHLSISQNKVRDCQYYGSMFNAHGYYSDFVGNDIRDCVYSSVFDTSEYGDVQKTELGEPCFYSKRVNCHDNICYCTNATLLVTWAEQTYVHDNKFSGMCLCVAKGSGSLGENPDASLILPTCKIVSITDNECDCGNIDEQYSLSHFHQFVYSASTYDFGGTVTIERNTFFRARATDAFPFFVQNADRIAIRDNTVLGCYKYDASSDDMGLLNVASDYSYYYPLKSIDITDIDVSGNTIMDDSDRITPVVVSPKKDRPYRVKKMKILNNKGKEASRTRDSEFRDLVVDESSVENHAVGSPLRFGR